MGKNSHRHLSCCIVGGDWKPKIMNESFRWWYLHRRFVLTLQNLFTAYTNMMIYFIMYKYIVMYIQMIDKYIILLFPSLSLFLKNILWMSMKYNYGFVWKTFIHILFSINYYWTHLADMYFFCLIVLEGSADWALGSAEALIAHSPNANIELIFLYSVCDVSMKYVYISIETPKTYSFPFFFIIIIIVNPIRKSWLRWPNAYEACKAY